MANYKPISKVYANLVKNGLKTIDEVPLELRDEVIAILAEEGIIIISK